MKDVSAGKDSSKRMAAERAAGMVQDGMVVGLGSGTTATFFIQELGERVRGGLGLRAIASSKASEALARSYGITICDFASCPRIDLAVDGADEVGPGLGLIKGGGGSLLREKIVASAADRFVIVADSSKVVERLGKFPLPVEVIQMAAPLVGRRIEDLGMTPVVRRSATGEVFVTDEGNYILDCSGPLIEDAEVLAAELRGMVGLVEHGLFLEMAEMAIIADGDGIREMGR